MTTITTTNLRPMSTVPGLMERVKIYISNQRAAKRLAMLDDHLLKDIGIHRGDITRSVWGV